MSHVYDGVQLFWSSLNAAVMNGVKTAHISVPVTVVLSCLLQCDAFGSRSYTQMDDHLSKEGECNMSFCTKCKL